MEQIDHKYIAVNNGLKLHVAEIGSTSASSPVVLFLHGFPEIWYSWRHQMVAVAKAGFRVIAPDYRGYGPVAFHQHLPEGFYMSRWKEPGRAEKDFGRFDAKTVVKNIYILFSKSEIPIASENQEIMDLVEPNTPLPTWSLGEMETYATGHPDPKVEVPTLLIMGEKDYVMKFPGIEDYIRSGQVKNLVPNLEIIFMPEGTHFVQEQSPSEVNQLILNFLNSHMDAIVHKYIETNGLKLHIAECGNGPSTVVFLHGFPEIWYSWRHQMMAVANAGFKVIAPDFRGYGLSDPSPEPDKATFLDLVNDLVAILDDLGLSKIFLISHDFGARPACQFTMLHPERVMGLEPGRAEADFSRFDVKTILRNIYILFSRSELPIASENQEIMDIVDEFATLPPWFTEEDLDTYADLYKNFGFHSALKVPYRSLNEEFKIQNPRIELPTLIIMGEKDYSLKFPGVEDTLMSGKIKAFVPNLEMTIIPEGSHFVHEQFPDEVNNLIITFLRSQHL
ncbi:hypothetical protein Leryth_012424 [Lithospermum erythrorhizon]|nr:hypothetical protein Leryth_012424 [Lithospermum erythrorhizon]